MSSRAIQAQRATQTNHGPMHRLREAVREFADPMLGLRRVVDEVLALVPAADGAAVELVNAEGWLTYCCTAGRIAPFIGTRMHVDSSLSGMAIAAEQVLRCDDTETDPRVDSGASLRMGIRSLVCVPLLRRDHAVGVFQLTASEPNAFADADIDVLTVVADFLAVMVGAAADLDQVTASLLPGHGGVAAPRGTESDYTEGDTTSRMGVPRFLANVLTPQLVGSIDTQRRVEKTLRDEALAIVFQPIFDLASGDVAGYEALSRFPDGRAPDVWFAEATSVGLGIELEMLAIRAAIRAMPACTPYLSVNVSPHVLSSSELRSFIEHDVGSRNIVVELTEHESVTDYHAARAAIAESRAAGIRIAIDDVGSGFAGLRHIADLRPDIIKIDRTLISYVDEDPARYGLAAAFNQLAMTMGWTVVAEGIERPEELEACRAIGINCGQGYLLGRPAPLPDRPASARMSYSPSDATERAPELSARRGR